jgi:heme/copper-type cytochrome/quinol oxidase subunit 2
VSGETLTALIALAVVVFLVVVLLVVRAVFRADRARADAPPPWRKLRFGFFLERIGWPDRNGKDGDDDE